MKIKLLQTKVYVNNQSKRAETSQLRFQVSQAGQAGSKSILKMLTSESICLMAAHVAQDMPKPNCLRCGCARLCSLLIRSITKVCAVQVLALWHGPGHSNNLNPIRRAQPRKPCPVARAPCSVPQAQNYYT